MRIVVSDYISIGSDSTHTATSYEVSTDSLFINIIDSSYKDTKNIKEWHSMLPNGHGGYYSNLDKLYSRVKVWLEDSVSDWYVLPIVNQRDQNLIVTEDNKPDIIVNTLVENIKTYEGY